MDSTSLIYSCLWQQDIVSGGLQPLGYGGVSYQVTYTNQNPALSLSADQIPFGTWPQHEEPLSDYYAITPDRSLVADIFKPDVFAVSGGGANAWDYISNGASVASAYPTISGTWAYNNSG